MSFGVRFAFLAGRRGRVAIRLLAATEGKGVQGVPLDQKRARWFGVLFLITFVTSIPALLLYEPALRHPVSFIAGSGNVNEIYLGALLELLLIIANIGTAVSCCNVAIPSIATMPTRMNVHSTSLAVT